jgi:hypothetical protein
MLEIGDGLDKELINMKNKTRYKKILKAVETGVDFPDCDFRDCDDCIGHDNNSNFDSSGVFNHYCAFLSHDISDEEKTKAFFDVYFLTYSELQLLEK